MVAWQHLQASAPIACGLFQVAWPSVVSSVIAQATGLTTILFVTSFRDPYLLGSVGLGAMAQNVFGFSLGMGINSALDTLVSQSNGAGEHELSGLFLWQAQTLSLAICLPCIAGLVFAERAFGLAGIDPQTAHDAGRYVQGTLFAMPLAFLVSATRSYLRSCKITHPDFYASVVVVILHPLWCILFLFVLDWGSFGAGFTVACSNAIQFLLLSAWILLRATGPIREHWRAFPWPCKALRAPGARELREGRGFRAYLAVALPSALLLWSEWWVYEFMSLFAGLCGTIPLAAHTACCNMLLIMFMAPVGLAGATSSMVGNAMGEGSPRQAWSVIMMASSFVATLFVILAILVLLLRFQLSYLFNSHDDFTKMFTQICLVMSPFIFVDAVQTVLEGAMRGLRMQKEASTVKLVSMVVIRLIGAYILAFPLKFGVLGIWYASLLGMLVTLALYLRLVRAADLDAISVEVRQRMRLQVQEGSVSLADCGD